MGITLNLQCARAADVHVGRSPLAELMSVLHIMAEPDHHPEAQRWSHRLGTAIAPSLAHEMSALSPLWARLRCRLLFPLELPLDQPFDDELRQLERLPLEEFVELCSQGVLGFREAVPPARSLLTDPEAAGRYVAQCERRSFRRGELAHDLVASPEGLRGRLLDFLDTCAGAFFAAEWRTVRDRLESAAAQVRGDVRRRGLAEVLAGLSPTAVVSRGGSRVRYDKLAVAEIEIGPRPLFLIPSVHVWPHLTVKDEESHPVVLQFAAQEGGAADQLTQAELRARMSALASLGRMELCRHLLGEPITTSELAQRLGLADSQVSRTLRQLRDAGLIESEREGKYVYHRLVTSTLLRLGQDVLATIMR
ncbi:helix-turn-helix domain-containing protein [Streptomyces hygroscopicus]|uniref:helix-turn-helix domain-containing protein n=1 Tax=Streptomyces hygroscopicus TaxID=1912 RepID=UPI0007679D4D|nr:helix-turn-helix domain-containing protein [Streptomyces hygroscopicus]